MPRHGDSQNDQSKSSAGWVPPRVRAGRLLSVPRLPACYNGLPERLAKTAAQTAHDGARASMDTSTIVVRGAREHNLQNVNLELPRNQLIVFTGVSGSGKSSLAFDTLYAEGQRRYVESLSAYARQFLGQLQKPDVDFLAGLSPSISIQQKAAGKNPRSTVGTITEIHDYLRVLFARAGQGHCPNCGRAITAQSREQILSRVLALPE